MTRVHINIKDSNKADKSVKPVRSGKESLETLFGSRENREISLIDIREKAWNRSNDTL
jgi:hypothetical protein